MDTQNSVESCERSAYLLEAGVCHLEKMRQLGNAETSVVILVCHVKK